MKKKTIAIMGIVGVLLIGGAFAYFSGTAEQKKNNYSVVKGGQEGPIEVIEPKWDPTDSNSDGIPDKAEDVEPGQLVSKDPQIHSKCEYDGWVVVKVSVPTISAELNGTTGVYDTFDLIGVDTTNFKLLKSTVSTDASKKSVYYYGYKKILPAGQTSEELFKQLKMKEFTLISAAQKNSVDLDAAIVQKINPNTGVAYNNIDEVWTLIGEF